MLGWTYVIALFQVVQDGLKPHMIQRLVQISYGFVQESQVGHVLKHISLRLLERPAYVGLGELWRIHFLSFFFLDGDFIALDSNLNRDICLRQCFRVSTHHLPR